MSDALPPSAPLQALIIGSGFGGLGMAIALRKAGILDFLILEKQAEVGGVWRDNRYPGAACDVPSHLYSFSFEPNPNWSRVFATQPEIFQYLRHCADKYQLRSHLRFGAEVAQVVYDEATALWTVTLVDGRAWRTRLVITAMGQLSRTALPRLDGIDQFKGRSFHSAHWEHSQDLKGQRVAVVGTGASAIQFVPAIADAVSSLTVFQRTPSYLMPRADRVYTAQEQARFRRMPWLMKLHRAAIYAKHEAQAVGFLHLKFLMALVVGLPFKQMLARQVSDPVLRQQLTPDYQIGCKRILLSTTYLATMSLPHVQLVTQPIRRVTPDGIETQDGQHHAVDTIVYGTGFAATEFLAPIRVTGREGLDLNQAWQGGAQAYLGVSVPGFPNFFMLYGPNTNLGHNSIIYMLESQIAHVMRCVTAMQKGNASTIEVDATAYHRFNAKVQARLADTVWAHCQSWYLDASGRNSANWPGFTLTYRWLARRSSLGVYRLGAQVG